MQSSNAELFQLQGYSGRKIPPQPDWLSWLKSPSSEHFTHAESIRKSMLDLSTFPSVIAIVCWFHDSFPVFFHQSLFPSHPSHPRGCSFIALELSGHPIPALASGKQEDGGEPATCILRLSSRWDIKSNSSLSASLKMLYFPYFS